MAPLPIKNLLERGYLPEELPPPFTSVSFAKFAEKNATKFVQAEKEPSRLKGVDYSASKAGYPNAVVALMGMHARTLGLLKKTLDITAWKKRVSVPSLEEEWWLFAYECATKGWIKQQIDWTTIEDSVFERMKKAKVSFYRSSERNEDVAKLKKGRPSIPATGFGYDGEEEKGKEEEDDFYADM